MGSAFVSQMTNSCTSTMLNVFIYPSLSPTATVHHTYAVHDEDQNILTTMECGISLIFKTQLPETSSGLSYSTYVTYRTDTTLYLFQSFTFSLGGMEGAGAYPSTHWAAGNTPDRLPVHHRADTASPPDCMSSDCGR